MFEMQNLMKNLLMRPNWKILGMKNASKESFQQKIDKETISKENSVGGGVFFLV